MSLATLFHRCHQLLVPLLATVPLAAQASFTPFGTGCLGLGLTANGLPRIGTTWFVGYAGPLGSSFVGLYGIVNQPVLLLGTSNTQAGGASLPAPLPTSLTAGLACDLLVSPDVVLLHPFGVPPPFGLAVTIPATPGLIGFTFHAQWLLLSERSYFGTLQWVRAYTSNAGTAVVGP